MPREEVMDDYPNARDCEHGRQRGKCADCDLVAAEKTLAAADRLAAVKQSCDADGQVAAAGWDAIPSLLAAYLTERGR